MLLQINLDSLAARREDLSRRFFRDIMDPASCLHSLLPPPSSTAITSRLRSSQILPKVYTRTKCCCSFIQYDLNHYQWTYFLATVSIWLFVLLLAMLYDHTFIYVGLFVHSAVVFHVFSRFYVLHMTTNCVVVFYEWHCITHCLIVLFNQFSCIAGSLFNKLIYLLRSSSLHASKEVGNFQGLSRPKTRWHSHITHMARICSDCSTREITTYSLSQMVFATETSCISLALRSSSLQVSKENRHFQGLLRT